MERTEPETVPFAKDAPPAESVAARPRAGPTRCPYCHDVCEADKQSCACSDCLSRHHARCWEEAGHCASCRSTSRLGAPGETPEAPRYGGALDAWARLWVVYNVTLTVATALSLGRAMLDSWVLTQVIVAALIANVCFMLGPSVEFGARRLGYRGATLRRALFAVGLALALALTLGTCMDFHAHHGIVDARGR